MANRLCWNNPIIVHQAGQYHITLAPQLSPRDGDSHLKNLREFSEAVLLHHSLAEPVNMQTMGKLQHIEDIAHQSKIDIRVLQWTFFGRVFGLRAR